MYRTCESRNAIYTQSKSVTFQSVYRFFDHTINCLDNKHQKIGRYIKKYYALIVLMM